MVKKSIRDPIHGFIELNEWEKSIIDHPVFQRLRRIKQLGWTDMVYPSANHTRFEHSLGVMFIATKMYDNIVKKSEDILIERLSYNKAGLKRDRMLVRLAALLHDVGHSPFSHVGEKIMPKKEETNNFYTHEDYSGALVLHKMKEVIEEHSLNQNYHITVDEIYKFLQGKSETGRSLIWRNLISSQLDADRADYLLRDSYHIGVKYGEFDLDRLIQSLIIALDPETSQPTIAVDIGGKQVAESLIISRYMMFTQVYFHHTRRAYDILINKLLRENLPGGFFPKPNEIEIDQYISWNDWKVNGIINSEESRINKLIKNRKHYRCIYETSDNPDIDKVQEIESFAQWLEKKGISVDIDEARKSWYKFKNEELYISDEKNRCVPLSSISNVVKGLKSVNKIRIYVPLEEKRQAKNYKSDYFKEGKNNNE